MCIFRTRNAAHGDRHFSFAHFRTWGQARLCRLRDTRCQSPCASGFATQGASPHVLRSWRQNLWSIFLCCLILPLLCGCRVRLTSVQVAETAVLPETEALSSDGALLAEDAIGQTDDNSGDKLKEIIDNNGETIENPDSLRKEFDENASVEITGGTDRLIHQEGKGEGSFKNSEDSVSNTFKLKENADDSALLTVPADEAEETGVSEDGEEADSMLEYYTVLLQDRNRSLFECKRLNVYWETPQDHVTIFKTSPEHSMILNAGAYDVSARLMEENLTVDDGWVVRKNPGVIVKVVPVDVLGSSVSSEDAADIVLSDLRSREGWNGIDAIRQERVVLLSEELLSEPWLQTAAMLVLAKTANPDLYEDIDLNDALRQLALEATGSVPEGVFWMLGAGGRS